MQDKGAFSEETLLTQQREMDRLSQELDQALNEVQAPTYVHCIATCCTLHANSTLAVMLPQWAQW